MGMRVHKVIGYGLDDLEYDGDELIDKRLNLKDGYLALDPDKAETDEEFEEIENRFSLENYIKELDRIGKEETLKDCTGYGYPFDKKCLKEWQISDSIIHIDYFGPSQILLFIPPGKTHDYDPWLRWDASIDYIQEQDKDGPKHYHKDILGGIYPYNGLWQDGEGNRISYAEAHGMAKRNLDKGWRPMVPQSIVHLCKWTKVFSDDKYIHSMKPMFMVYWC